MGLSITDTGPNNKPELQRKPDTNGSALANVSGVSCTAHVAEVNPHIIRASFTPLLDRYSLGATCTPISVPERAQHGRERLAAFTIQAIARSEPDDRTRQLQRRNHRPLLQAGHSGSSVRVSVLIWIANSHGGNPGGVPDAPSTKRAGAAGAPFIDRST